jgi:hypothetical protein
MIMCQIRYIKDDKQRWADPHPATIASRIKEFDDPEVISIMIEYDDGSAARYYREA